MYVPNPLAFAAAKFLAYSLVGAIVKTRGATKRSALGFGLARTFSGWVVGFPLLLAGSAIFTQLTNQGLVAWLALPRLVVSAVLIHVFFHPRGGWRETFAWSAGSVAIASIIDVAIMASFERVDWLRIPWC
jgi:hypothetical protein